MSAQRVNLVSLLALLFLVLVLAITPETRQLLARLAFWAERVEERLEASRRPREPAAGPAQEEGRTSPADGAEAPAPMKPPPHVVQGPDGEYHPEPGYSWVNDNPEDLSIVWVPGARHPEHPGVIASREPDQWRPAAGYEWAEAEGVNDLRVVWTPGKRHPDHEHVLAAEKQEEWQPEPGYRWLNDDPNDLSVVPAEGATPPGGPPPPPAATPP